MNSANLNAILLSERGKNMRTVLRMSCGRLYIHCQNIAIRKARRRRSIPNRFSELLTGLLKKLRMQVGMPKEKKYLTNFADESRRCLFPGRLGRRPHQLLY